MYILCGVRNKRLRITPVLPTCAVVTLEVQLWRVGRQNASQRPETQRLNDSRTILQNRSVFKREIKKESHLKMLLHTPRDQVESIRFPGVLTEHLSMRAHFSKIKFLMIYSTHRVHRQSLIATPTSRPTQSERNLTSKLKTQNTPQSMDLL